MTFHYFVDYQPLNSWLLEIVALKHWLKSLSKKQNVAMAQTIKLQAEKEEL